MALCTLALELIQIVYVYFQRPCEAPLNFLSGKRGAKKGRSDKFNGTQNKRRHGGSLQYRAVHFSLNSSYRARITMLIHIPIHDASCRSYYSDLQTYKVQQLILQAGC